MNALQHDLFADGARMVAAEAVDLTVASMQAYGPQHEHWAIAVLADTLFSQPDPGLRLAYAEQLCAELRAVAAMPGSAQPRNDMEVVSWQ